MHTPPITAGQAVAPAGMTPEALAELVRRAEMTDEVGSYLQTISLETTLPGTKVKIRWHRIAHDATLNKPDIDKLIGKLMKLLIDFACPRSEIEAAKKRLQKTGSAEGFSGLQEKARRLFTRADKAGEVGELLLFLLAERLLGYPQVLCKMPLKTNPSVHAHGADGVHASLHPTTGHLRLHWGEAKLYADFNAAIKDCCESLKEMLRSPADAKKTKERDLELLRDNLDLTDPVVEAAVMQYLDPDNSLSNQIEFCGLALVGFNYADYAALCTEFTKPDATAVAVRTALWAEKIKAALEKHELIDLTIDTLCIPCTSVDDIRNRFKQVLGS